MLHTSCVTYRCAVAITQSSPPAARASKKKSPMDPA
jgi:hypothetical protein